MTPEDLTAIGIKNPAHRKKLKSEISKLSIGDGIPNHVPVRYSFYFSLAEIFHKNTAPSQLLLANTKQAK